MPTDDSHLRSSNVCQKLFHFFVRNLLSRPLKRLTSKNSSDHDVTIRQNHNSVHVQFRHSEDDDQFESWTRVDRELGSSIHIGEAKEEANPGKITQKGAGRRTLIISDGMEEDRKGKKKVLDNSRNLRDERMGVEIEGRNEEELDGIMVRPHLISVASNINEKSDEFIKSRIAAMRAKP